MNELVTKRRRTKAELALAKLPQPPSGCSDRAYYFWPIIVSRRAVDDWNEMDLEIASRLCESLAMHKAALAELATQSLTLQTVRNRSTTVIPNPLIAIISGLANDIRSWYRTLGIKSAIMPSRLAHRAETADEVIDETSDFPVYNS
jgi:phage terminase small subunit